MLEIKTVPMEFPADANIIVGQAHFIQAGEHLYEAVSTAGSVWPRRIVRYGSLFNLIGRSQCLSDFVRFTDIPLASPRAYTINRLLISGVG
jgi:hypothetical protein